MSVYMERFRELSRRTQAGIYAVVLTFAALAPVFIAGTASAAPSLQQRQLTSTSARPGQTTQLEWTFNTTADTANVDYIEIQFCDTPLTACTTVNTPTITTPTATLSGPWTSTGNTTTLEAGLGGGANNQIQIDKTTVDDATSKTGLKITLGATNVTNNASANKSYYTRMRLYSDAGTTLAWEGVFAQSTSQTLTVNARVQERLDFCVGSTDVNDAAASVGATCGNITGTTVNLGNVESGMVNVSPVDTANGGDTTPTNGVAMVRTNAVNGVVVDYKAVQDNGSGQLKVPGATCVAPGPGDTTDQCFNTSAASAAFTPGTEKFGMTIAGVNCGSTTAYTCDFANDAYNLRRDTAYNGNGTTGVGTTTYLADSNQVNTTTSGNYAWQGNGTATRIASSAGSSVKVVDDEALILKFAATAGITTPTGAYTVQADFIATATF